MKLIWFEVEKFRRFSSRSKLNVDGKLVAIVGPNEAGKTSLLDAMVHFNHAEPFRSTGPSQETTRGTTVDEEDQIIKATFLLDDDDRKAIAHIPEASDVRWYSVSKQVKGETFYISQSPKPMRDLSPRRNALSAFDEATSELTTLTSALDSATEEVVDLQAIRQVLCDDAQTLPKKSIRTLQQQSQLLDEQIAEGTSDQLRAIPKMLREIVVTEQREHPESLARNALYSRRPKYLVFGDDDRLLQSAYNLQAFFREEAPERIPNTLQHIAGTVGLSLQELFDAASIADEGRIESLVDTANEALRNLIETNWSQSNIIVRLRLDGMVLHILIRSEGGQFDRIAERSDGLRQFLALLLFLSSQPDLSVRPIILIDELERHLHYDAQADLVQMLGRQNVAAKVIYTTHSIGCLPEDLGTGVRIIEMEDHLSRVENWFWNNDRPGFSRLLFGMGANAMSFIPVRYAVLTEGAADLILLPALLKEVLKKDHLGFQVVPGLSSATQDQLALIRHEAARMAFLTDNDENGRQLQSKIRDAGISDDLIHALPKIGKSDTVLEDFLEPTSYVNAINEELTRSHGDDALKISEADLPRTNRALALDQWCQEQGIKPPSKRAVAYRLVESRHEAHLAAQDSAELLASLYTRIRNCLEKPK